MAYIRLVAVLRKTLSTCIFESAPKRLSVRFMLASTAVYKKSFCRCIKVRMLKKKKKEKDDDDDDDFDDDDDGDDDDENEDEEELGDDDGDDDGVLMMVDVCTDGVVMMVMGKMIYDKVCRQQLFGKTKALRGPFRELVVSVLMVSVLTVDGVCPPAGVLVVSQLCFGGRWRLGGTLAVCP